ncbi:MAG: efflux RND transporter periplasmic adaptor subunit [Sphingobium sp.]|nr:efflux RND transporter periplasmic adaptor subunit [Sphingobium sp.]
MTSTDTQLDEFLGAAHRRSMPKWVKWTLIAVGVVVLLLIGRHFLRGSDTPNYATAAVHRGDMEVHVTATGNLKPTNQVTVGSEISGLITDVLVDENDRVVKGQPLAQIDPVKLQDAINRAQASLDSSRASVLQAEATANQSTAQLARQEEVFRVSGGKVPSKTELDTARADAARARANVAVARANVNSAAAQLSSARTDMSKSIIRSPVTGVVLSRQVDPGQTVAASFNTPTLFLIAEDLSKMELEVKVDEADVGQVHEGQTANFTVDAYPGKTFPANIKRVNVGSNSSTTATSSSSASSGVISYGALLTVNNPEITLRPGMTATATIVTSQEKNVLLVPNAALRFEPGKGAGAGPAAGPSPAGGLMPIGGARFRRQSSQQVEIGRGSRRTVYTIDEKGKLQPHEVFTGNTNGTETIVTSKTLKPGMKVVTGELAKQK